MLYSIGDLKSYVLKRWNDGCKVFAFTGHIGAGKNYVSFEVGKRLQEYGFNVAFTSFASNLKKLILDTFGYLKDGSIVCKVDESIGRNRFINFMVEKCLGGNVEIEKLQQIKDKYNQLIHIINQHATNNQQNKKVVRLLLQEIGEYARSLNVDVWANSLCDYVESIYETTDFIFITDLRYLNEYHRLKDRFGGLAVIKITSPIDTILKRLHTSETEYKKLLKHPSEKSIDKLPVNITYINI